MKDIKFYKSAFAGILASITLFSGCSSGTARQETTENEPCTHLTIYFEDGPITFKECEGWDVVAKRENNSSEITYNVKRDNKEIFSSGVTTLYNAYNVYHDVADEIIENKSVQKVK